MIFNLLGKDIDKMPNFAFKLMSLMFNIRDRFVNVSKILEEFYIKSGHVVIDYGCGPGSFVNKASEMVGENGKVFAVDIHELAIEAINSRIKKDKLDNVKAVLANDGKCPLEDNIADIIYALDMFHMISKPKPFLQELNRLIKNDGFLFISDGHQSRKESLSKIKEFDLFDIIDENKHYIKCKSKKI